MLSDADKAYLKHKHTGGLSNQKGNTYENYYAINLIAALLIKYKYDLSSVTFQTQVPMTFVDDLLIICPNKKVYHQIKDVKELTWKSGSSKPLKYDFRGQVRLSKEKKEIFNLKLVHSHVDNKLTPMPWGIKQYTSVEYFPAFKTLNDFLISDTHFQNNLRDLLYNGATASLDQLFTIASHLLGCWNALDTNSGQTLKDIDLCLSQGVLGYRSNVTTTLMPEFCKVIERIGGTNFIVSGSTFFFDYKQGHISIPLNDDVQQMVIRMNPSTPLDLLDINYS